MAPTKSKKRGSNSSNAPRTAMADTKVPLRAASPSTPQRSPIRKQKQGITIRQKQALIDNLQLEITERARRLRSQYNLQAQGLKSRIEIRINRIPISVRKMKMGDLLLKAEHQEQKRVIDKRPPVPAKDAPLRPSPQKAATDPARVPQLGRIKKRLSDDISGDKENARVDVEYPKKKTRSNQADRESVRPAQILSPTSSNSRLNNRERPASPAKSQIARPGSPLKSAGTSRSAAATNILSSMVEKAKATRAGGNRNITSTSNASSASSHATGTGRGRKPAAAPTPKAPVSRPATRLGRRGSADTETSEGSSAPTAKRGAATKTATATKRGVLGSMRKGITAASQAKTPAKTPVARATTGRALRSKRA